MKKKEYQNPEMEVVKAQDMHLMVPTGHSNSRSASFSDDNKAASWHVEEE